MSQVYGTPALLVEMDKTQVVSFVAMDSTSRLDGLNRKSVLTQLLALPLHFPGLQLLWTFDSKQTADLFAQLKQNRYEPNLAREDSGPDEQTVGLEMLRKLPGVQGGNHKQLLKSGRSLRDMLNMREDALAKGLGKKAARDLHRFATCSSYGVD